MKATPFAEAIPALGITAAAMKKYRASEQRYIDTHGGKRPTHRNRAGAMGMASIREVASEFVRNQPGTLRGMDHEAVYAKRNAVQQGART